MYKYVIVRNQPMIVMEKEDVTISIPLDESNSDYQAYLAWVAEGNEAEEVEQ
jgi:hypothetical protein